MQRILSKSGNWLGLLPPVQGGGVCSARSFFLWDDSWLSCQECRRFQRGGAAGTSSICALTVLAALQHECSQTGHRGARGSQAWRSSHLGHSCAGKSTGLGESGDLGARPSQPPTTGPPGQVTSSLCASADSNKGVRRLLRPRSRTSHLSLGLMPQV